MKNDIPESVKREVWERAEGMCEIVRERFVIGVGWVETRCCGSYGLSIHHKKFKGRGGSNNKENLILGCMNCHDIIQRGQPSKHPWIRKYRTHSWQEEGQTEND